MALTNLTPVENWTKIINDNYALLNKLPLNGAITIDSPATFLNGTTGFSRAYYLPFNGGKLVLLSLWQIATTTSITRHDLFSVPTTIAPSQWVGAILNECSYVTNRHATANGRFTFWSSNTSDNQTDMDCLMVYLHFD